MLESQKYSSSIRGHSYTELQTDSVEIQMTELRHLIRPGQVSLWQLASSAPPGQCHLPSHSRCLGRQYDIGHLKYFSGQTWNSQPLNCSGMKVFTEYLIHM